MAATACHASLLLILLAVSCPPGSQAEEKAAEEEWKKCPEGCPDLSSNTLNLSPLQG